MTFIGSLVMLKDMDKKLSSLLILFLVLFSAFIVYTIFNTPITNLARAKEEFIPSSDASLIFAWPLTAKANSDRVNINVFIRNADNLPLANKTVTLETSLGVLESNNIATDKSGKANFILTSDSPGLAEITAVIDNQIQLKQNVSIKFE